MESLIFDCMAAYDYENLFFCQEKTLGLRAIIAIHNTTLGPAAGGIYDAMQNVIAISKERGIPTHRAADILAEQRIASVGQAKRLAIFG